MRVSLVVSSYNQPNALRLVLEGILTQTLPPSEIVFADDGSEADTKALVDGFASRISCRVTFTTQDDRGFRKAMALNNAIRETRGDVVLFLDGDCVPPPTWVAEHAAGLRRADFTVGGYVWLDLARASALTPELVAAGGIVGCIRDGERAELLRVHRRERFYRLLGRTKKPRILGGNWAVHRHALIAVNGFDESFDGFTKEDSDIRNRLRNAGYRGLSLWSSNWVFHCSHELDPRRNRPEVTRGKADYVYYRSRADAVFCERGLARGKVAES